jgi:sodium transport system permease protein
MVFFASIITGSGDLVLMGQYATSLEEKASVLKVRIAGQQHAPALVNFLQPLRVQIETAPADYENLIREGAWDAVIVVPKEFDQRYLTGEAAKVEIVYDDSRAESARRRARPNGLLRAFNRETGMLRLGLARREPGHHRAGQGAAREHRHPAAEGAPSSSSSSRCSRSSRRSWAAWRWRSIPTAGERERGSLEPLLGNPVALWQVVVGKWLAAWTFAAGVATLTLGGFVLAAALYAGKRLGALMTFGAPEFAHFRGAHHSPSPP